MANIKEYVVTTDYNYDVYIVLAKDAKEAINAVCDKMSEHGMSIDKKELTARSTGSLHNEQGKVVMLHL